MGGREELSPLKGLCAASHCQGDPALPLRMVRNCDPDEEPEFSVGGDVVMPEGHPDYEPPSPVYPPPAWHPEAENPPDDGPGTSGTPEPRRPKPGGPETARALPQHDE